MQSLQYGGDPSVEATGTQRSMHSKLISGQGFDEGTMLLFRQVAMFDLWKHFRAIKRNAGGRNSWDGFGV